MSLCTSEVKIRNRVRRKAYQHVKRYCDMELKCQNCGKGTDIELHHPDYNQPLLVNILCFECHRELHKAISLKYKPINLENIATRKSKRTINASALHWVKSARAEKRLSQSALADLVGVTEQYIYYIEAGERRPSVESAKKIANALGFAWTKFFPDEDAENREEAQ